MIRQIGFIFDECLFFRFYLKGIGRYIRREWLKPVLTNLDSANDLIYFILQILREIRPFVLWFEHWLQTSTSGEKSYQFYKSKYGYELGKEQMKDEK